MSCTKRLLSSSLGSFGGVSNYGNQESGGTIEKLSTPLMADIILRLPVKSIITCKCVCKSWYDLILDPLFAKTLSKTYAENSPPTVLVRSDHSYGNSDDVSFYFVEIGEKGDVVHRPFHPIAPHLHENGYTSIKGSCNGLLCMEKRGREYRYGYYANKHNRGTYIYLDVFVINPLWRDYMVLPVVREPVDDICNLVYGFGVNPSTNKYKVLRLVTRYVSTMRSDELEVYGEIFTIGDDQEWRYINGSCTPYDLKPGGITLNGAFHWIRRDSRSNVIFAFDIGKEKGQCVALPPGINHRSYFGLAVWSSHLCFLDTNMFPRNGLNVDVWIMKQYGVVESWTKDIILTSSIPKDLHSHSLIPVTTLSNGDLLISHACGRSLLSFDPKTNKCNTIEVVRIMDKTTTYLFGYVPNFFSLRDALKIGDKFVV